MRLRSIDILRGLAASAVVLFHSLGEFRLGAAGVDLFFVISGYVICGVLTARPTSTFLVDRALRIFPIYWLALIPWIWSAIYAGAPDWGQIVQSALLFPMWVVPTDS